MASSVGVKVEGLALTTRALKRIDAESGKLVALLNREAAATAAEVARPLAPFLSGKLAGTIRAGGTQRFGYVVAGSAAVPYAAPIHWGWPAHNISGHAFLTEGLGEAEPRIADEYERGFMALIHAAGL